MRIADTPAEAESKLLTEAPALRILQIREIDLSGLPPLRSGQLPKHWVAVVEHSDPEVEKFLPQHDDPAQHCEREVQLMYLKMAIDPDMLTTGLIEQFDCPACSGRISVEMPPHRERPDPYNTKCSSCEEPIRRRRGSWEVIPREHTSYPTCVFCGERANSREHVIPAWIAKRLNVRDTYPPDSAFQVGLRARKQPFSFATFRARVFCASCNWHFKHLEDAVIPLLEPMARGRAISLARESQELLALWAAKTAIALFAAERETFDAIPESHRQKVRFESTVPETVWIRYFSWQGGPVAGSGEFEGPKHTTGYCGFLAFAGVGFSVLGYNSDVNDLSSVARAGDPLLTFHPADMPMVTWPPIPSVDNRIVPRLLGEVGMPQSNRTTELVRRSNVFVGHAPA